MTKQEALQLLDNIVSKIQLARADHDLVKQAIGVLAQDIVPKPQPAPKPQPKKN